MTDSKQRARRVTLFVCFVLGLALGRTARADDSPARRLVVVLRPSPGSVETWPEGTQAVVAELVAGGYELMLRASVARDHDGLLAELATVASERPVLASIVVLREGARGIAYVYTEKSGTVAVEAGVSEGAVGEGALALRITQLLGPPELDVPETHVPPKPPPPMPAPPPVHEEPPRRHLLLAVDAGLAFSSDLSEPLPLAGIVARTSLVGPLSLDAAGAVSLGASRLETDAGSIDLFAEELTLHLSFDPFRENDIGVALGLGGGVLWVQGKGQAHSGFSATDAATSVALLSARATAFFTHNQWSLLVGIEPGVMLPAVSVGAGNEIARLGRPWTQASVGLGWNL